MQFSSGLNSQSARILDECSRMQVLCHFHQGKDIPCLCVKESPTPANPEVSHEPAGVCPASETRSFSLDIAQDSTQLSLTRISLSDLTGSYGRLNTNFRLTTLLTLVEVDTIQPLEQALTTFHYGLLKSIHRSAIATQAVNAWLTNTQLAYELMYLSNSHYGNFDSTQRPIGNLSTSSLRIRFRSTHRVGYSNFCPCKSREQDTADKSSKCQSLVSI